MSSTSSWFATLLAVICLPVILLLLEADAQPTADETELYGLSRWDDIVNVVKTIASTQQCSAHDIKDKIDDVKQLIVESKSIGCKTSAESSARNLECECLVSF